MQQLLKCGRSVIRRNGRLTFLLALSLMLSCCSDSPTQPTRVPRNTFPDYQHISGYVSGVWTKEHNPYVITGEVYVEDGDSLVVGDGVSIVSEFTINVRSNGRLIFRGTPDNVVRFTHNAQLGGGVFVYSGELFMKFTVVEGHAKSISLGCNSVIEHVNFIESVLGINLCVDPATVVVRNCIFAGYRPWESPLKGAQFRSWNNSLLDSAHSSISNNVFYTGIGDSSWAIDPDPIVDVWIYGENGNREVKGPQWPGNGNLFGDPKWVKYNFVGPSPAGISDNDYHLQPGSPAIGAASDGTNIGAY